MYVLYNDDCFNVFSKLPDKSIDMILCDLPYGTSACKWDSIIPLDKLWAEYTRVIKPNRAIVLFSQQPFTTMLIGSNLEWWKYNWIWRKDNGTNFLNSHYQPLKVTEDICVFGTGYVTPASNKKLIYNPQFSEGKPYKCKAGKQHTDTSIVSGNVNKITGYLTENKGVRYPTNVLEFKRDKERFHPTQKPVALCEYLIKTYTNENDVVLDNCMGSGTTGVACNNLKRHFIGIEKDYKYFGIAKQRIQEVEKE